MSVSMDPHMEIFNHRTPFLHFTWQSTTITGINYASTVVRGLVLIEFAIANRSITFPVLLI